MRSFETFRRKNQLILGKTHIEWSDNISFLEMTPVGLNYYRTLNINLLPNQLAYLSKEEKVLWLFANNGYIRWKRIEMKVPCLKRPKYTEALQDYFNTKRDTISDISIDTKKKNSEIYSEIINTFLEETDNFNIDKRNLKKILSKQSSELELELFLMYEHNEKNELEKALKIGETFVLNFMRNLHQTFLKTNSNFPPEFDDPAIFFDYLAKNQLIFLKRIEIKDYYKKAKQISKGQDNIRKRANDLFELLSDFCYKIDIYHYKYYKKIFSFLNY